MSVDTGAMASLLPKLGELLNEKYKLRASIRKDVKYLIDEMERTQAFLLKVAEVPRYQLAGQVKLWAEDARKLSYDMEVAIDKLLMLATNSEGLKGFMEKMGSLLNKGKTRHQIIANAIKSIKADVSTADDRRWDYEVVAWPAATRNTNIDPRLVAPYTRREDLVGVDGKKDQELMKLLSDWNNKRLKIVSVVGFGGLGKTTLVKTVYDKIKWGFDCKAFVPARRNAAVKKVLVGIILDLGMYESHLNTLEEPQLIGKIRNILQDKRYLIVIDDIWNENLWAGIKYAFSNENDLGSRIITTTRKVSVSKACCSSVNDSVYQMQPLSDDDSRKLLYDRILSPGCGCPYEFEQVSGDILKKCGGVPLAIITVAFLLTSDGQIKPEDEWHALLKSIGHALIEDSSWKEMQRIVSFSYYDLPLHLKTCLLYLSIFPVGHPIERDRLVKKWIAEGIVNNVVLELSLEEAGSKYLNELVNNNVIQPLKCNNNCEVIRYHIHPMMHDVLKAIAIEEKFAALLDDKDISSAHHINFRNLCIDCPDSENLTDLSSMAFDHGVRSLTVFGHANRFLLRNFEGIRVLDLEGCKSIDRADLEYICSMVLLKRLCLAKTQIAEIPPEIGNLQYLEGLDVGGTQITELPPQIGKLQHLKTLDARKSRVKELPDQVIWLTGLVHLLIGDNESSEAVKLPVGIGKMTSLQQLCTIDLRKCSASSLKELVELPYLKEIAVVLSDEPEDTRMNDALLSSLDMSTKLRSLVVCSDFRLNTLQSSSTYKYLICQKKLTVVRRSLKVPIIIAGHCFIGMLDIRVCKLEEDDLKILRELPRLQSLIVRLEVLPTKLIRISCEGFAKLESFNVDCRMPRLIFEEGAMPKLEHLELKLYAGSDSKEKMCIRHLLNLQKVTLRYSKWYATNKGVKETTDAVRKEAKEHQNEITLCISEEDKGGKCIPKTEIFQENKDARCSRMSEIKQEDGHEDGTDYLLDGDGTQEGGLQESSRDIASCSGTKEIEEVVE